MGTQSLREAGDRPLSNPRLAGARPPHQPSEQVRDAAGHGPSGKRPQAPRRILIIDDNTGIHEDFRKLLCPKEAVGALDEAESALFGHPPPRTPAESPFILDTAIQGREGLECVKRSLRVGQPYAMAFVDMRMPPGWDGVETVSHMWGVDPGIEVVICSAYFDYSWNEVMTRLARPDRVRLLLKPFSSKDAIELAWERTNRWLARQRGEDGPG
jgi:CheY-like chemotaxis protein